MGIIQAVDFDLWQTLKEQNKPIYLYGMGDGALKIMSVLNRKNIPIKGVYANDEYVRGHSFCGYKVMKFDEVNALEAGGFISLLAFATEREPLLSFLYTRSEETQMYAPDVPVVPNFYENGDMEVFDLSYFKAHENDLNSLYNALYDELSKSTLQNIVNFKLTGEIAYLKEISTKKEEIYTVIKRSLSAGNKTDLTYVDLGAFTGDTFFEFYENFHNNFNIQTAYLVEPDAKNFKRILKNIENFSLDSAHSTQIIPINAAAWAQKTTIFIDSKKGGRSSRISSANNPDKNSIVNKIPIPIPIPIETISVDDIFENSYTSSITSKIIIKLDVEGAESESLKGCEKTIKKYKPTLMISAYHKNEDLFALFAQIMELNPNYKVYLRHHPYIPAWETCLYFI